MTNANWIECTNPQTMIDFISEKTTDRKLRQLICATSRQLWHLLIDERTRKAVEIMEEIPYGHEDEIYACQMSDSVFHDGRNDTAMLVVNCLFAYLGPKYGVRDLCDLYREAVGEEKLVLLAGVIRDIFGNPFRPVVIDPRWLTSNVVELTRSVNEERAFDRLPILADALMDADCTNADMLAHCRDVGPHVRGCWVIDRLLGNE